MWKAQRQGVAPGTNAQQDGDFGKWQRFLGSCGIVDPFLEGYGHQAKLSLFSAFAAALRRNEHGKRKLNKLSGKTIRQTINSICLTFRTNLYCNPLLEGNGQSSLLIKRQIDGYITEDPPTKPQKCLPPLVFKKLYNSRFNELSTAIGQLTVGALFFGMRSCEYSKVTSKRKTEIIKIKHVRFFNIRIEVKKSAQLDNKFSNYYLC